MHWLNLELKTLHSPEYIGSDPVQRATWLALLGYCAEQENGGTIRDCSGWKDRQWQQTCGVTLEEVKGDSALWRWEDGAVVVTFYPTSQETEVQAKREGGRRGGAASAQAKIEAQAEVTSSSASSIPSSSASTKGKVREGNERERKEKEVATTRAHFVPPTLEEVREYVEARGYHFSPEGFIAYYEVRNWVPNRATKQMTNWHSACVIFESKVSPEERAAVDRRRQEQARRAALESDAALSRIEKAEVDAKNAQIAKMIESPTPEMLERAEAYAAGATARLSQEMRLKMAAADIIEGEGA